MSKVDMKLRPYQREALDNINQALHFYDKILFQLSTGGGKTFIFCNLIRAHPDKKILILVNRAELVQQTAESLAKFGISAEPITSKTKALKHYTNVYVAMEKTLWNRLKKDENYLPGIDLAIADECHRAEFDKFLPLFPKTVGFTATPVRIERFSYFQCHTCKKEADTELECHGEPMREYSREHKLSDHYEKIIVGPDIQTLIDEGFLMPERPYAVKIADTSNLKTKNGEYTEQSINKAYNTSDALFNVVKNYKAYCRGRKTMIFSASTKQNKAVYDAFIDEGIENVRHFDSKNSTQPRKELVEWFRDTPEAVLCNVNVFTTGFDVTDVEAIIVNRPTKSLSLWLQIVGRGARPDHEAGKTDFVVVDGGENIKRLNQWSDPTRDWERIFREGLHPDKAKKESLEDIDVCPNCGAIVAKSAVKCASCGYDLKQKPKPKKEKEVSDEVAVALYKTEPPDGKKIIEYCKRIGQDRGFAFKIMFNQMVDLFRSHQVKKETYIASLKNGNFDKMFARRVRPVYFELIRTSEIEGSRKKTIQNTKNRLINKINKHYGIT